MLAKAPIDIKKNFARTFLVLFVLGMLVLTVSAVPVTKAQGYPHVPTFAPSTPTPTPTATPKSSPTVAPSPTEIHWNFPTTNPTKTSTVQGSGFWSPINIGLVTAALVGFTVPLVFFYFRRGKQEILLEKERPINTQELPVSNKSLTSSRYPSSYQSQQYTQPTATKRYGQPTPYSTRQQPSSLSMTTRSVQSSSTSRVPPYTKTCPHCKRAVRNDQNVCPYCYKKIK
jgi:hypothetical protein